MRSSSGQGDCTIVVTSKNGWSGGGEGGDGDIGGSGGADGVGDVSGGVIGGVRGGDGAQKLQPAQLAHVHTSGLSLLAHQSKQVAAAGAA